MQLDVQPFAVGETKFFAISSPSPFGKSMVNKPDGTPLGGVAKIWDEKTRKSSEVVTDHLAASLKRLLSQDTAVRLIHLFVHVIDAWEFHFRFPHFPPGPPPNSTKRIPPRPVA